jgi:hypothetical protein
MYWFEKKSSRFEIINKMQSAKKEIIKLIKETLGNSTIQPLPRIINNPFGLVKLLWLCCSIVSIIVLAWFFERTITDYLCFKVITNVNIVEKTRLIFPIVSICNLNFINSDLANQFILSKPLTDQSSISQYLAWTWVNSNPNKTIFGQSLNETIMKCEFAGKMCDLSRDFEPFYDINYGNCFRFNSREDKYTSQVTILD